MPESNPLPDRIAPLAAQMGVYRPGYTSPQRRYAVSVARQPVVEDTLEILRSNARKKSKHHFLFIGPRGIGKTHLLHWIEDEISKDSQLRMDYVVARFPEESYRILSFADFLMELCRTLSEQLPGEPMWGQMLARLRYEEDDQCIIDTVVPALRKRNRSAKQTILVVLENLQHVFMEQIKKDRDIAALRKFLMDDNRCLMLATAPTHFDAVTDVGQPFYDFFDIQILEHLSQQETLDLIRKNLEWDQRLDLLEQFDDLSPSLLALYCMTGGNPRLIVIIYHLIQDQGTDLPGCFQQLLDRITPYYQDRMNDLPPQERALLETMACMRDQEKTPASIAMQMRQKPQQTSSLLQRLSKASYLHSIENPEDKRSRLYVIREGFFDIWLAMNLSHRAQQQLPLLLQLLERYYRDKEDQERIQESESQRVQEKIPPYASSLLESPFFVGKTWALTETVNAKEFKDELEGMIEQWSSRRTGQLEALASRLIEHGGELSFQNFLSAKIDLLKEQLTQVVEIEQRTQLQLEIARLLSAQGAWEPAEILLREILNDLAKAKQHPHRLRSEILYALSSLLFATDRAEEALPLLSACIESLRQAGKSKSSEHLRLQTCADTYRRLLIFLGKTPQQAEQILEEVLAAKI